MAEFTVTLLNKSVPDAYHGTSLTGMKKILRKGFSIGRDPKSFLGDGVYFYEGSPELARIHAAERRGYKRYRIFQATVQLGRCLNLNTPEHCDILRTVRSVLIERKKKDRDDLTDAFIINWYALNFEKQLDTVIWTLTKGLWSQIYPRSRFRFNEPMIWVRNVGNISNISVLREPRG